MNSVDGIKTLRKNSEQNEARLEFGSYPIERLHLPTLLFAPPPAPLKIKHYILQPIIAYRSGDGLTVIDGCKRLLAAQSAGKTACDCCVLTPAPEDRRAALLRIRLNCGRKLDFREKYLFVRWLKENCSGEEYEEVCDLLILDKKERFWFEQLAGCDGAVVDAVESGALEACFASEMNRFAPVDRDAVLTFFRRYAFSLQMQRELLDWLPELAFREKCTIPDLLSSEWLGKIENDARLNAPQKIRHLRVALFNRRFPLLARAKEAWKKLESALNPDRRRVVFKPFDAFEKNRLEINVSITSAREAGIIFKRLSEISEDQWDRLIYPAQSCCGGVEKKL